MIQNLSNTTRQIPWRLILENRFMDGEETVTTLIGKRSDAQGNLRRVRCSEQEEMVVPGEVLMR